ncbi:MAG: hydrogen peroxide-inducible genes activator [Pseudomonadota bacterium]
MAALPSLRNLRYLVALADRLNFTRAAEDCRVTQSTLSAGVKELEEQLGVTLVERDRSRVVLTEVGEEIVARARSLLAAAEDLTQVARAAAEPFSGTLRLGAIPTIAPFLLPEVLPAIRAGYPALTLMLREDFTDNLLARLRRGELDFALIALPYDTGSLVVQRLFDDELQLIAPARHPLLAAPVLSLDAIDPQRLVLLEEGHCLRGHTLAACGGAQARGNIEANSLYTLIEMVASGLGLALLPLMAIRAGALTRTALQARPFAPRPPVREVALVARPTSPRSREFAAIAELIRNWAQAARGAV